MADEFYIGYEPEMPRGLALRIRLTAIAMLVVGAVVSGVLVIAQSRFANGTFEYDRVRMFEGRLIEYPYPALLVSGAMAAPTMYWLVGLGKHGASEMAAGRDGRLVRISGSLIERDGDRMIEVRSIDVDSQAARPLEPLRSLGPVSVSGEIVDGKCHLGVMKPGEGPTHRDCAVRCLIGRITPMFAPRADGKAPGPRPQGLVSARAFWRSFHWGLGPEAWGLPDDTTAGRPALIDPAGRALDAPLDSSLVGRPVVIRGELWSRGPLRFLAMTPSSIQIQENGASFLKVASTHR
jgi:hypothetical protein